MSEAQMQIMARQKAWKGTLEYQKGRQDRQASPERCRFTGSILFGQGSY